jgi:hypothetical protein
MVSLYKLESASMPYCPKCGSHVEENEMFCGKCGTQLSPPRIVAPLNFRFPPKPSTNLVNGIIIGSGITLLIIGLIGAFALNSYYWEQTNALSAQGLKFNTPYVLLNNLIEDISLCWTSVFFGIYFLALGIPSQFSPLARAIWARSDYTARAGNGLITGGFVFAALSAAQSIREFYIPDYSWYPQVLRLFILGGVIIMALGVLLRTVSYLRSHKSATKV